MHEGTAVGLESRVLGLRVRLVTDILLSYIA